MHIFRLSIPDIALLIIEETKSKLIAYLAKQTDVIQKVGYSL